MMPRSKTPARVVLVVGETGRHMPLRALAVKSMVEECPELHWVGQVTPVDLLRWAEEPSIDMQADLVIFMLPEMDLNEQKKPSTAATASPASTVSAASAYRARYPNTAFAFLTDSPVDIRQSEVGPYGVIALTAGIEEIMQWLLRILNGEQPRVEVLDHPDLDRLVAHYPMLTERELEVIVQMTGGLTNDQIATRLGIAEDTVKIHVSNVLRKTNTESRFKLVCTMFEKFWVRPLITKGLST